MASNEGNIEPVYDITLLLWKKLHDRQQADKMKLQVQPCNTTTRNWINYTPNSRKSTRTLASSPGDKLKKNVANTSSYLPVASNNAHGY
jgi:hypothetical protein